jgi:hypothetical protein
VKISWSLPPAVVDLHAEWMDLEAQLQLRARASPWSPPVDGAHARDAVELGPGWIHAPLGLKVTRRSAAHRPLGEKMRGRMPLLTAVGRSRATAHHCALRRRGRCENMNHRCCCSMKARAGWALPRSRSTAAHPPIGGRTHH